MIVRLKCYVSNVDYRGNAGQLLELPESEALRLIESGQAEAAGVPETTSVAPPRTAMRPQGRPRRA